MKILNLKIKSKSDELIRDINFNDKGISFIFGDIRDPEDLGATINSLGKTLLLKMIDYIYGANEDSKTMKKDLEGIVLEAYVTHDGKEYNVFRTIGKSKFLVDGENYELADYKRFFDIERSIYQKQFLLTNKVGIISSRSDKATKDDIETFLKMLSLYNLIKDIDDIYNLQDSIKRGKASKKDLATFYEGIDEDQIDEEIYFVDKGVEELTNKVNSISEKIKNIEISENQKDILEEYSEKSENLKKIKSEIENQKLEIKRLEEFIISSNKIDITAEHLLAIYNKAKQEVPEMVKKELSDVEDFHKIVYKERKDYLENKKIEIEQIICRLESELIDIAAKLDELGKIISNNEVYQESILIYEKYNADLQNLKYKQGNLSQIKNIDKKIGKDDEELVKKFKKSKETLEEYEDLIKKYKDFIFDLVKEIYNDDIQTYFDIKLRDKHQTARPINIELNINGDAGEGVNEVRKNVIDYIIFKYSSFTEIMVQDSSCYNGIDPRQICNMLSQLSIIAQDSNKQAFVSLNRYQLGDYTKFVEFVEEKSSIILSENDKLLKFNF
ncbi:DUF2326 domain-containing protein [Clostridioides mangenotii]|uniref:DUF2326 domain-containing protein n=1 Tax=Metaclostridioides mangenotii TaxID=1540 RepID=UPI001C10337C|nr:DUF2326 domain-containing protein [Clostridioides mangenotii]MBU5308765.1 DUF2326 domain-containing protein [Clostridioides mangenotii]